MPMRTTSSGVLPNAGERRSASVIWTLVPCWLVAIACGMGLLIDYENRPGDEGEIASLWPDRSQVELSHERYTLLLFAHPRCPCTRATLDELAWVMTRCRDKFQATVLFLQPEGESTDWARTDTWDLASRIPEVRVLADVDGREAQNFGTQTSGHVVVFNPSGKVVFQGGITPSRGHRGDSPGRSILYDLASQEDLVTDSPSSAVYGCPLFLSKMEAAAK